MSDAQKSLTYGQHADLAILVGMVSALDGGVIRDMLLSRVPAILEREIYASAALLGAIVFVASAKVAETLGVDALVCDDRLRRCSLAVALIRLGISVPFLSASGV